MIRLLGGEAALNSLPAMQAQGWVSLVKNNRVQRSSACVGVSVQRSPYIGVQITSLSVATSSAAASFQRHAAPFVVGTSSRPCKQLLESQRQSRIWGLIRVRRRPLRQQLAEGGQQHAAPEVREQNRSPGMLAGASRTPSDSLLTNSRGNFLLYQTPIKLLECLSEK